MKGNRWLMILFGLGFILAGCDGLSGEPNVWMVKTEAPVIDAASGLVSGTAYKGFMISLDKASGGKASFSLNIYDSQGAFLESREYVLETKYMEKVYSEPVAVIEIISGDLIRIHPGAILRDGEGNKLLRFSQAIGPFRYIQKSGKGYMFTIDANILFAGESDVDLIPTGEGEKIY